MSRVEILLKFEYRAGWNERAGWIIFENLISEQGKKY